MSAVVLFLSFFALGLTIAEVADRLTEREWLRTLICWIAAVVAVAWVVQS